MKRLVKETLSQECGTFRVAVKKVLSAGAAVVQLSASKKGAIAEYKVKSWVQMDGAVKVGIRNQLI